MAIPLAIALAGTAISAWSSYQAGQAEADAFGDAASAKRKASRDVMKRFDINAEFARLEGESFKGKQISAIASSGIDVGSGLALATIEDTAMRVERSIMISEMEAETQRDALLMGADLDADRAKAAGEAGILGAVGSVASGTMSFFGS